MTDTAVAVRPEMAAPRFDYLTLAMPGCQVLVGGDWLTVKALLPCVSTGHGPMCTRFQVNSSDWEMVHLRLDRPRWLRHQISDVHPWFDASTGGGR